MVKNRFQYSLWIMALVGSGLGITAFQSSPQRPTSFEPIFMTRPEMEGAIALLGPRAIDTPGKIWVYNSYILLVEQYRGVHIINNTDPNNSVTEAFIRIDGCTDIAVNDGILFANNAVDMIGIKYVPGSNDIEVVSRNRNILPVLGSPDQWGDWYFVSQLPENMIIVRWIPL